VNGKPFADFRDSDDRLGPVLEVFLRENYVWLPCEQIKKITIPKPKQLRDLLWTPATIESGGGPSGEVYLPVLYVGSHGADNDQLRLGRITDWRGLGDGLAAGVGQKTFLVDDSELSILEIREIEFHKA
jgi:type VI secretion system protein ImpE